MAVVRVPLDGLRPDEFIFFTSYALSGLVLPFSSFFTLFEKPSDQYLGLICDE
jgi:hypothetical protein